METTKCKCCKMLNCKSIACKVWLSFSKEEQQKLAKMARKANRKGR